jgi:uncharacterized protein
LGFGGAALGLPLLLFVNADPLLWLPMIGLHLLFFSGITLRARLHHVDWGYIRRALIWIVPPALVGVFNLVSLPTTWILAFIYLVAGAYALMWALNRTIHSDNRWLDRSLLIIGGYIAGTTLSGAPLIVAVFMRHVHRSQLRDTLFVLWFMLVTLKMLTFVSLGVSLHLLAAVLLLPIAAIGHVIGLRVHDYIMENDQGFKRWIGWGLLVVSLLGLWQLVRHV